MDEILFIVIHFSKLLTKPVQGKSPVGVGPGGLLGRSLSSGPVALVPRNQFHRRTLEYVSLAQANLTSNMKLYPVAVCRKSLELVCQFLYSSGHMTTTLCPSYFFETDVTIT
ncbi:hypothetical protein AVEN_76584-1 [Araneus ventricosus]|uniref:Uncharacterized protein n=1 Tax=Araneus ventricosus TaxID=182803 RepID=A0A4Y2QWM8_ARAVE|nr:hypothetical protein AVEN_76584-1 [Araneus ventricosus]